VSVQYLADLVERKAGFDLDAAVEAEREKARSEEPDAGEGIDWRTQEEFDAEQAETAETPTEQPNADGVVVPDRAARPDRVIGLQPKRCWRPDIEPEPSLLPPGLAPMMFSAELPAETGEFDMYKLTPNDSGAHRPHRAI
jgi:hypothetical protein